MAEWAYSSDSERYGPDTFETQEQAIEAGTEMLLRKGARLWVAQVNRLRAGDFIRMGEDCVNQLAEVAWDLAGEAADGWPDGCDDVTEKDLCRRLRDCVNEWADVNGLQPQFWAAVDGEEVLTPLPPAEDDGAN
jgi:hypothetical protein